MKFSHYIKYKNPNYINIALYSFFFFGLVLGEKPPVYFFLFGIFEILAPFMDKFRILCNCVSDEYFIKLAAMQTCESQ